jgi:hypothetical protein
VRPDIVRQVAYERRLVRRCQHLIAPLLEVAGFEARIILYPRESPARQALVGNASLAAVEKNDDRE